MGIYFLDSFVGGGVTEYVLDENDIIYAFITFNANTLHMDLSEWITYRDNTAFKPGNGKSIGADFGTEYTGFIHILLHETTHIVDFVEGITPYLRYSIPSYTGNRRETDPDALFTADIWQDFAHVKRKYDFDLRRRIAFYGLYDGPFIEYIWRYQIDAGNCNTT